MRIGGVGSRIAGALAAALLAWGCAGEVVVPPGAGGVGGGAGGAGGSPAFLPTGKTPTVDQIGNSCSSTRMAPPLLRRMGMREFANTVRAAFQPLTDSGVDLGAMITVADDTLSSLRLAGDASVLLVGSQTAKEMLSSAEAIATQVTGSEMLMKLLPCASNPDEACAVRFITDYGARLFRRPVTGDEQTRYAESFRSIAGRSDFRTGLKWTLVAMLQSPAALYRSEVGVKSADGYRLTPHEIAGQLSYNFGGVPPSPELLARAESGALADPAARADEARRLLMSPGGRVILQQFFRQWSFYPRVITETRKVDRFTDIRAAMTDETQRFIDEIIFNRSGGVKELLTAPITLVNPTLAQFYSLTPGAAGADGWSVADRPADASVGLLAQGSILAGNAHIDSSSPTLRGLLVFERLLCNPRPPPPPNVPRIETPSPGVKTTRQRYEETHASGGTCPACHSQFDPIGFAFERFDEVGRFRSNEAGLPINAAGSALAGDGSRVTFDGLTELAQKLAAMDQVANCVGGFLEAAVFGGGGGQVCLAAEQRQLLRQGTGLLEFTAQLAASPNLIRRAAP